MRVAGYAGDRLFERGSLDALYRHSGGVPRLINVIAHKALLAAYGEGAPRVSRKHVARAAQDTPAAIQRNRSAAHGLALAAAAVSGLAVWLFVA